MPLQRFKLKNPLAETDRLIEQWLAERQELLVLYTRVAETDPFPETSDPRDDDLKALCEILVDYVSAGHFEVFEKLAQAEDLLHPKGCTETWDKDILVNILKTTMVALTFSNYYTSADNAQSLKRDLSYLGEQLAQRFDLEDELINCYSKSQASLKEQVAV